MEWNEMDKKKKKVMQVKEKQLCKGKQAHLIIFIVQSYRLSLFKHTE